MVHKPTNRFVEHVLLPEENAAFKKPLDVLSYFFLAAIAVVSIVIMFSHRYLSESRDWMVIVDHLTGVFSNVKFRFDALENIQMGYGHIYIMIVLIYPVFMVSYSAIYLLLLVRAWKRFEAYRPLNMTKIRGLLFFSLLAAGLIYIMIFARIFEADGSHGSRAYIFVPPTFVVFSLLSTMLASYIIFGPTVFLMKFWRETVEGKSV